MAHLRQAEVQNLHLSALGKKQIRRLDVPVHDPLGVGRFERIGDLKAERQQLVHFHGLPAHLLRQGLALQQLHDDEVPPFVLFNGVDGADVRVIERGSGARLALEALQQLAVLGHFRRKKLQGHAAAELGILGFVHHSHATRTQFAENLVMQEGLADEGILIHIRRLMVSGGAGAVKETGGTARAFPQHAAASLRGPVVAFEGRRRRPMPCPRARRAKGTDCRHRATLGFLWNVTFSG